MQSLDLDRTRKDSLGRLVTLVSSNKKPNLKWMLAKAVKISCVDFIWVLAEIKEGQYSDSNKYTCPTFEYFTS